MSADLSTVPLRAAEMATEALVAMSALLGTFPELEQPIQASTDLVNCAISQTLKEVGSNGHSYTPDCLSCATPIDVTSGSPASGQEPPPSAWEPDSARDVNRCKALMLEILRRAAHDWVLYRQHRRMKERELAEDAYTWLFEEEPGHPNWKQREAEGTMFTSFLIICECLDLDVGEVRARVRQMDVRSIIASGRPAETRHVKKDLPTVEEHGMSISVDVDKPANSEYVTRYESYGSIATPSMLSLNEVQGIY